MKLYSKHWSAVRRFFRYIKMYFTHDTILQFDKKGTLLKIGQWYHIGFNYKKDENSDVYIDDFRISVSGKKKPILELFFKEGKGFLRLKKERRKSKHD